MTRSVPQQPVEKRKKNFSEATLNFSKKQAEEESRRCLQCADPVCVPACPVKIDIPGFIRSVREGDGPGAFLKIYATNPLTSFCGRLCSRPCESACVLTEEYQPIAVRALERFAFESRKGRPREKAVLAAEPLRVAVIGSGPAGLTAAIELARLGYKVVLFESLHKAGGVLRYGIPEFRLPPKLLEEELAYARSLGVEIRCNVLLGQMQTLTDLLREGFRAVLLAIGCAAPEKITLPGHQAAGVLYAEEFLMSINLMKAHQNPPYRSPLAVGQKVLVLGGGQTALDCARLALRLSREVVLATGLSREDLKMDKDEAAQAEAEGVRLECLTKPLEIVSSASGFVKAVRFIRLERIENFSAGKESRLTAVKDSDFVVETDMVVSALGHRPQGMPFFAEGLRFNKDGSLWHERGLAKTSLEGVFVAGNAASGSGPLVQAIADAQKAVLQMHDFLKGNPSS